MRCRRGSVARRPLASVSHPLGRWPREPLHASERSPPSRTAPETATTIDAAETLTQARAPTTLLRRRGERRLECCSGSSSAQSGTVRPGVRVRRHGSSFVGAAARARIRHVTARARMQQRRRHRCWSGGWPSPWRTARFGLRCLLSSAGLAATASIGELTALWAVWASVWPVCWCTSGAATSSRSPGGVAADTNSDPPRCPSGCAAAVLSSTPDRGRWPGAATTPSAPLAALNTGRHRRAT